MLLFSQAVSLVAMPAMAGLLIVAGVQSIKKDRIADVWSTGWAPAIVMLVTLVLTLAIPLQQAVFLGVLLSILAQFFITSSARDSAGPAHAQPGRHGEPGTAAG